MLALMRNLTRSPLAIVIIALLIASFALWGINDIFTRGGNAVAIVGPEKVTVQALNQEYEGELRRIQTENPGFTREQADQFGLGEQVLQRLIGQAALRAKANTLNLGVSDETILDSIREIEAFRSPFTGEFDAATYRSILAQNNMTPQRFEAQVRDDLRRGQISTAIFNGIDVPDVMIQARQAYQGERRALKAIMVSPALAGDIEAPTDEALTTFISENAQYFTRPEQRRFTLVRFDIAGFTPDIDITEETLREQYEFELESGSLGTPATRTGVSLLAGTEDLAQTVATRLANGERADALAQELGLIEPESFEAVQAYQIPDEAVASAAFEMQAGESRVVEGRAGWKAVYISGAEDTQTPSFEEHRETLRQTLAETEAQNVLYDAVTRFQDAVSAAGTLEEAAAQANVPYETFDFVTANGFTIDQEPVFSLLQNSDMVQQIFELPVGFASDIAEYGDGNYFAARVDAVEPERLSTLDEVREQASAAWRAQEVDDALTAIVTDIQTRMDAGEDINAIADELGTGARVETATLTREQTAGDFNQRLVSQAFGSEENVAFQARAGDGRTRAIVMVEDILPPLTPTPADQALVELQNGMAEAVARRFETALSNEYEPRIDPNLRDIALGRTQPQAQ